MRKHKLLVALAVLAFTSPAVGADDQPIEIQIVDAMNKLFGIIPGSAPITPRAWWSKAASQHHPGRRH